MQDLGFTQISGGPALGYKLKDGWRSGLQAPPSYKQRAKGWIDVRMRH